MDSIARIIAAYDAQGIHRTGTDVDDASARWLAGEIERLGVTSTLTPFTLDRVDAVAAYAKVAGTTYEGLPRFDAPPTGPKGISGRLGLLRSDAEIGLVETAARGDRSVEAARRGGSHAAMLNVTLGEPAGLTPINADDFNRPFGPPVLQLSNEHRGALERAAKAHAEATVVIDTRRTRATACNVEARIAGSKPDLAPVVVMTPRSGWWRCASERGGGLVLFLEIMRAVKAAAPARDVIFTANSGHELGHLGLDRFIHENPDLVKRAHCWIHLGANFGAAIRPQVRLQASDETLFEQARAAMQRDGVAPDVETPVGTRARGEARNIFDGGGRYVSLLGGNGLFHHPDDRWPDAVDAEKLAKLAQAFCALAVDLARE